MGHHVLHDSAMDALYRWPPMRKLIAALTNNTEVFLHEDPTNALVELIMDLNQGSADLGVINSEDMVLMPMMNDNRVIAISIC